MGRRDDIMARLRERRVGVSVYYPKPVPDLTWYRERYFDPAGNADKCFPVAARLCADSIALPVGPHLDGGDMAFIVEVLKEAIAAGK